MRIALADDHAMFREGIKTLLTVQDGIEVVAETSRVEEVPAMLDRAPCDVLLLDLEMERNALNDIAALAERVAVVVLTASESMDDAVAALRAGAQAVVSKRFAIETLNEALEAVRRGSVWMPPEVQTHLASSLRRGVDAKLSPREREIVRYVALGLRNAEVAQRLFISPETVKTHLNAVFRKLGVRDRIQLSLYAVETGIIRRGERA
jgi:DNA-binding NarL/FixJ family response regulator